MQRPVISPDKRTVDVEWRAFESGVKPAFRLSATPEEAASIGARYEILGASVAQSDVTVLRERPSVIVYVARSDQQAKALRDVERHLLGSPSRRERRTATVDLGLRLGYPRCCVDAFALRNHGGLLAWLLALGRRKRGHDAYLGARDAYVPNPHPRINPLLMPQQRTFISFDPCRYDCPHALALAERIVDVLAAIDAEWVRFIEHELARPVVIASHGARAHVELEELGPYRRIRSAEGPRDFRGDVREVDADLAATLVGKIVGPRGLVRTQSSSAPPVLIDFSAGGERLPMPFPLSSG